MNHDLERFLVAQGAAYDGALRELRAGRKTGHWIWFVFPQIAGLGRSEMSQFYAIVSLAEARAYLAHPVLGARLREGAAAILAVEGRTAEAILGVIDAVKLRSSMTLFAHAAERDEDAPFRQVLEDYFDGEQDPATVTLLGTA